MAAVSVTCSNTPQPRPLPGSVWVPVSVCLSLDSVSPSDSFYHALCPLGVFSVSFPPGAALSLSFAGPSGLPFSPALLGPSVSPWLSHFLSCLSPLWTPSLSPFPHSVSVHLSAPPAPHSLSPTSPLSGAVMSLLIFSPGAWTVPLRHQTRSPPTGCHGRRAAPWGGVCLAAGGVTCTSALGLAAPSAQGDAPGLLMEVILSHLESVRPSGSQSDADPPFDPSSCP